MLPPFRNTLAVDGAGAGAGTILWRIAIMLGSSWNGGRVGRRCTPDRHRRNGYRILLT